MTIPVFDTVAMGALSVCHAIDTGVMMLPSASRATSLSPAVCPMRSGDAGTRSMATEAMGIALTVTTALSAVAPELARMNAFPPPTATTFPAETVATEGSLVDHCTAGAQNATTPCAFKGHAWS